MLCQWSGEISVWPTGDVENAEKWSFEGSSTKSSFILVSSAGNTKDWLGSDGAGQDKLRNLFPAT